MEHEAGDVDAEVGGSRLDDATLHVNLHQTRRSDLVVKHAERVQQKVLSVLTNTDLQYKKNNKYIKHFNPGFTIQSGIQY